MSFYCPQSLPALSLYSVILKMVFSEFWILVSFCHDFNEVSSPKYFMLLDWALLSGWHHRSLCSKNVVRTTASSPAIMSPLCRWTYIEPSKHSVTIGQVLPDLTFKNFAFCPHSLSMCFVLFWQWTNIISIDTIKRFVFAIQVHGVCDVGIEFNNNNNNNNNNKFMGHIIFLFYKRVQKFERWLISSYPLMTKT
jgi:hypothetical protein